MELTRRGEPVALIISLADYRRLSGKTGLGAAIRHFRETHAKEIAELDLASAFENRAR